MSIVSKLFSRKSKTLIDPLVGVNNNQVTIEFDRAFRSLDFNPLYADRIGSYLVSKNPSIDGTVTDETPNRKTRTELTARATSFSTNQRLYGGNTSTGKTAMSVFAWARPTTLSGNKVIVSEFNGTGDERGYQLYFNGTELRVYVSQDGGSSNVKFYLLDGFVVNAFYHVGFTLDTVANELLIYVNGKDRTSEFTKDTDVNLSGIHDSTSPIEIGSNSGGGSYFDGQIQTPLIHYGAFTAAEVRDIYLGDYSAVEDTDIMWFLDGVNSYPLTSAAAAITLTAANTPTRYEDPEAPDYLNLHGWTGYENLVTYSEDMSGAGWAGNTIVGNTVTLSGTDRTQNNGGANLTAGTFTYDIKFSTADAGKQIQLGLYNSSSWVYADVSTIPADGLVSVEIDSLGGNVTNRAIRRGGGDDPLTVTIEYIHIRYTSNNSSYIATGSTYVEYEIRPKRINSNVDSAGNPPANAHSFGECKRNWQLTDGPCISLNGVNQYGVITNTDDYSSEDWVLRLRIFPDAWASQITNIISQQDGTGTGRGLILRDFSSNDWGTFIGGSAVYFTSITNPDVSKEYALTLTKSGTSFTLLVENLTDGTEETETITGLTMESADGDFVLGTSKTIASINSINGQIWGLKLDCTTDPTKSFEVPISDEVATISRDKSGNGKHITWQNSPSVGVQQNFFESEANGCSKWFSFNGSTSEIISTEVFTVPDNITISGWLNADSLHNAHVVTSNDNFTPPYRLRLVSTGQLALDVDGASGASSTGGLRSTVTYSAGVPVFVTVTYDGTNIRFYFNGVLDSTVSAPYGNLDAAGVAGYLYLGNYQGAGFFSGDLRDVRIYDGALTDAEVLTLFSGGDPDNTLLFKSLTEDTLDDSGNLTMTPTDVDRLIIPALADGSGLDVNGYPLNRPAGAYHHNSQALLEEFPVTDSGSQRAVGYGASFDGTLGAEIIATTDVSSYPFSIECDFQLNSTAAYDLLFLHQGAADYIGIRAQASSGVTFQRRNTALGGATNVAYDGGAISQNTWYSTKVTAISETEIDFTFEGVTINFSEITSVAMITASDLLLGTFRTTTNSSPNFNIKNVIVKQGDTVVNDLPLYLDPLDRTANCYHGTLSATGVSFATEARAANLNPTISQTNTRAVTTGDRKLIRIGQQ